MWLLAGVLGSLLGGPLWLLVHGGGARAGELALGCFLAFVAGVGLAAFVGESRAARRRAEDDPEGSPLIDGRALARESSLAERGDPRAMRRVGEAHLRGVGAPADASAALTWFRRGAERGDLSCALACLRLLDGTPGSKELPRPRQEALRWARLAAEAGNLEGMRRLGLLLVDRSASGADPTEGARWLLDAAERGDVHAMIEAAWCFERAVGAPRDEQHALTWYRRAASAGSSAAMVHLAALLERGVGAPPDMAAASDWYRRAAALGQPLAEIASDDLDDAEDLLADADERALETADRARDALDHRLDQASAHADRARLALERRDVVVAERQATRAIELLPDREGAEALALRASVREVKGELEQALADRRRATELRPEEPWSWLNLARLEALLGRRQTALEHLAHGERCSDEPVWFRLWRVGFGAPPAELEQDAVDDGVWTAWLARLLLRRVGADALLEEASSDRWPSHQHDENRCEVLGFAGLLADRDGDLTTARARYEACVATDARDFLEHEWSRLRLEQLDRARDDARSLRDLVDVAGSLLPN